MFIVYSPEGQSFIGSVQQLPVLKVDPTKRINKVGESELEGLKVDVGKEESSTSTHALKAYKKNQQSGTRQVIVKAAELMSSPVITIAAADSIENAWYLMNQHGIKHLPVVDRGELVGMCTQTNILGRMIVNKEGALEGVKPETVSEAMQETVVTTSLDTDVRHVAQALMGFDIEALVIMSDYHQIVGIVTPSDLIKRLATEPPLELYT